MTTYPALRTGYRSAPAPAVSDAAPTARPGEVATLGDGRRRVGASGPRDATAAVSVPQPGVAEHRAEVRPSHSHADGKRCASGGPGGDSLLGLTAGTAALWQLCACGHPLAVHDWEGAGCGSCPCRAWTAS